MPTQQQKEHERAKTRSIIHIGMAALLVVFRGLDPDEAFDLSTAFGQAAEARHPGWVNDLADGD